MSRIKKFSWFKSKRMLEGDVGDIATHVINAICHVWSSILQAVIWWCTNPPAPFQIFSSSRQITEPKSALFSKHVGIFPKILAF
eukprot:TRINITY_DN1902_c0_g1_i1.p1 TRINITY_DN1902_c0_g1~~TRINITY_DN1902_c0_g1_i1.p1  ORF type:complete len:84 (+),score=7.26 TRINITY_DN1902_c0_g1_i1:489-740(+)